MSKYLEVAVDTVLKTGKFLKKQFGLPKTVKHKGEIDIVTDSDLKAEEIIIKSLKKAFPSHHFLAEETVSTNRMPAKGYKWIIDPIDGTTNFAHGYPMFSISIALEYNSEIIAGTAYNPLSDELFTAEKDKGAYLNAKMIRVSSINRLSQSLLSTGFPYDIWKNPHKILEYNNRFQKKAQGIRRDGSAVMNLCYTACGRFDGFWEARLKPWDTASGILILKEAGGKITDFEGGKYSIYKDEILATNGKIHKEMINILSFKYFKF
jgi:myo-inositol-1(or 4)-monophosphatase